MRKKDKTVSLEEFVETVRESLQKKMGWKYKVEARTVTKNNGVIRHGLEIAKEGVTITPCFYLDGYYDSHKSGEKISDVTEDIMKFYKDRKDEINQDLSNFSDYTSICGMVKGKLVNTDKNADMLSKIPHREYLDLSLVYYIELPLPDGIGSIQIPNEYLKMWGITEETLFEQLEQNMEAAEKPVIKDIVDVISTLKGEFLPPMPDLECQMYVLSNQAQINGAVEMLRKATLKQAADIINHDYIIIPSSIHEVLLIPDNGQTDLVQSIAKMVEEVNRTRVAEEDVLSYHVYRYDRNTGNVEIAA